MTEVEVTAKYEILPYLESSLIERRRPTLSYREVSIGHSVCPEVFNISQSSIFFRFKSNAIIVFLKTFRLPRDKILKVNLNYNFNHRDWACFWPK